MLAEGGCPMCRSRRESYRQWMRAYVNETNADSEVMAGVRAARGFCADHLRLFIARTDAAFMLPGAFIEVVTARLQDLPGDGGPAPGHSCLICQSERRAVADTAQIIATVIEDAQVQQALADQTTVCLPHTIELLRVTPRPEVLRAFTDRFEKATGTAALTPMTGDDPHADARAKLLPALFDVDDEGPQAVRESALQQAIDAVGGDSCGACQARGVAAVRYLRWLAEARQDLDRSLDPVETALCAPHLHDLSTVDPLTASWIADLEHPTISTRLERLMTALGERRRGTGALDQYDGQVRPCPACRSADIADERRIDLFAAALPDPAFRQALAAGHGLCVVHGPALASRAEDALPREVLRARLQLLGWELAETRRKGEWWTRHERQGREMGAWRRAPTLLAGDTYLGLGPEAFRR